jgi:hypothetical protein
MADINLGQITGVWIENTEPPHTNLIWIKTINQNSQEKAGFVWDGANWINSQGKSTYQIWLDVGNTGTEQDFLDSLVGNDGVSIVYNKQEITLSADDEFVFHNHGLSSIIIDVIIIKHISINDRGKATLFGFATLNPTIASLDFTGYLAGDTFTVIVQSF